MRTDYSDGSFCLRWDYAAAWYTPGGTMKDCAKYYWRNGRKIEANIPERCRKVRQWLQDQGQREASLLTRGILKRRTCNH